VTVAVVTTTRNRPMTAPDAPDAAIAATKTSVRQFTTMPCPVVSVTVTNYPDSIGERSIVISVYVCVLHVCLSADVSLKLHVQFLCVLPMAVARSPSVGVAMSYVLPVLWMTSHLHIMAGNRRRKKAYAQSNATGNSRDLTPDVDRNEC